MHNFHLSKNTNANRKEVMYAMERKSMEKQLKRIFSRIEINNETGCWEFTGAKSTQGYGRTCFSGKYMYTHRLMYEFCYGEIPAGKYICHHCDNSPCCNPEHLYCGDAQTNAEDRAERNPGSFTRISSEKVKLIREFRQVKKDMSDPYHNLYTGPFVADLFDLPTHTIYSIWSSAPGSIYCSDGVRA
jgi:hypothetical protein